MRDLISLNHGEMLCIHLDTPPLNNIPKFLFKNKVILTIMELAVQELSVRHSLDTLDLAGSNFQNVVLTTWDP